MSRLSRPHWLHRSATLLTLAGAVLAATATTAAPASAAVSSSAGAVSSSAALSSAAAPSSAAAQEDITWGAAPANTDLGTGRPNFDYVLNGGTQITDAISIVNRSDQAITLKVYASDAFTTSTGAVDLLAAEEDPTDVGSWIKLGRKRVKLASQQSVDIPFTLTVPADASAGDHTGGIVTSLVTDAGDGGVALDRRLGSRILLSVPGTADPRLQVSDVQVKWSGTLNPFSGGSATVTYTVSNPGNIRLSAQQQIEISAPAGALTDRAETENLPELLPGASLTRTVEVSHVWPLFRLTATVSESPISSDNPEIVSAEAAASTSFWAIPWGQLAVLLAAVLVIWAVVAAVRSSRRRTQRRIDAAVEAVKKERSALR